MGRWVNGYSIVGIGRIDLGHNNHGKKRNYFRLCWLNKPSSMENGPNGAKRDNSWRAVREDRVLRRSAGGRPGQAGCVYCVRARSIAWKYICVSLRSQREWEGAGETIPDCVVSARGQPNGMVRDVATTAAIYQSQLRLTRTKTLIIAQA